MYDTYGISANIVTDIEPFRESLVRPNPYTSPDQPDVPLDKLPGIKKAMDRLLIACDEARKTGKTLRQLHEEQLSSKTPENLQSSQCTSSTLEDQEEQQYEYSCDSSSSSSSSSDSESELVLSRLLYYL